MGWCGGVAIPGPRELFGVLMSLWYKRVDFTDMSVERLVGGMLVIGGRLLIGI